MMGQGDMFKKGVLDDIIELPGKPWKRQLDFTIRKQEMF